MLNRERKQLLPRSRTDYQAEEEEEKAHSAFVIYSWMEVNYDQRETSEKVREKIFPRIVIETHAHIRRLLDDDCVSRERRWCACVDRAQAAATETSCAELSANISVLLSIIGHDLVVRRRSRISTREGERDAGHTVVTAWLNLLLAVMYICARARALRTYEPKWRHQLNWSRSSISCVLS